MTEALSALSGAILFVPDMTFKHFTETQRNQRRHKQAVLSGCRPRQMRVLRSSKEFGMGASPFT